MLAFRLAAACAASFITATAWSQAAEGVYQGELACGPLITQPTQAGWRAPVSMRLERATLTWTRGDDTYEETGRAGWSDAQGTAFRVQGTWKAASGRQGGWAGQVALRADGQRIAGTMTQTSTDGSQRFRECTVAATIAVAASAAAPATAPPAPSGPVPLLAQPGAPRWKDAPAYHARHAATALRRSTFFMPLFGAVYPEKFETLLDQLPRGSLRGVVIYNHGCGGQWGWETTVAQHFYRWGFAVITPDFLGREGNKSGCPGASGEEMLRMAGERSAEGTFQAINPARLAARGQDIQAVIAWLKQRTRLPIIVSGHSEGCRAIYAMHFTDAQVVGGACVKQGLQPHYAHTWRWNTSLPMWQSLEENDPWVVTAGATHVSQVTFTPRFAANPSALTVVIVPGRTHDPLNHENERNSLQRWLDERVQQPLTAGQNGMDYEKALPALQQRVPAPGQ
ncbi:hypothetical protein FN976_01020 [Caenimonas sedimenti]|uniref:Dienelactone hydrolase n=1 Tax=Caenimonas sedimenti TaxID=2596921 RepID=A0A562ZWV2_9BURK|nr:hypothetical protein [Caenimonas sedimenti]TWO72856.1 hypothetical protein FN976_01020 [Caenimonas sedimenti]